MRGAMLSQSRLYRLPSLRLPADCSCPLRTWGKMSVPAPGMKLKSTCPLRARVRAPVVAEVEREVVRAEAAAEIRLRERQRHGLARQRALRIDGHLERTYLAEQQVVERLRQARAEDELSVLERADAAVILGVEVGGAQA